MASAHDFFHSNETHFSFTTRPPQRNHPPWGLFQTFQGYVFAADSSYFRDFSKHLKVISATLQSFQVISKPSVVILSLCSYFASFQGVFVVIPWRFDVIPQRFTVILGHSRLFVRTPHRAIVNPGTLTPPCILAKLSPLFWFFSIGMLLHRVHHVCTVCAPFAENLHHLFFFSDTF